MDVIAGVISNITSISNASLTIDSVGSKNVHSYSGTIPVVIRHIKGLSGNRTLNDTIGKLNGMHVLCDVVSIQPTPGAVGKPPLPIVDIRVDTGKTHSNLPPVHNGSVIVNGGNTGAGTGTNGTPPFQVAPINGVCPPGYSLILTANGYVCQIN